MRTVGMIGASLLALTALCGVSQGEESQSAESGAGAWLGVTTQSLSRAWREQKNYWGKGVMVAEVAPGSPAAEAGVAAGDVLVSVAAHSLSDPREVAQVESGLTPWQPVSVVLAKDAGRVTRIFDLAPAVPPTAADLAASAAAESATASDSASPAAATEEPVVVPVVITSSEEQTGAAQPTPNVVLRDGLKALGVQCEDLDVELAMAAGAPEGLGVLVLAVAKDGPAQAAGIVPGDVISWAAGVTARDVAALDQALSTALSPVSMAIARSGTTRPVTIDFDLHAMTQGHAKPAAFEELRRDPLVTALRDEVRRLRQQIDMLEDRLASPAPADSH